MWMGPRFTPFLENENVTGDVVKSYESEITKQFSLVSWQNRTAYTTKEICKESITFVKFGSSTQKPH